MQIFCGSNDRLVPYQIAEKFSSKMKRKKNTCEFLQFDGRDHSFFNLNVDPVGYEAAIGETDRFLVEQGFLEASEEIEESRLESWREQDF